MNDPSQLQEYTDKLAKEIGIKSVPVIPYSSNECYGQLHRIHLCLHKELFSNIAEDISFSHHIRFITIDVESCERDNVLRDCIIHELLHQKWPMHTREFFDELKKHNANEGIQDFETFLRWKGDGLG